MRALVTGGTGFVGTNLIKRLLKDKCEVVSIDNYSAGYKENHQDGCAYYDYDLSSSHTLGIYVDHSTYPVWRDDDYDVIFHMAALARIQPSIKNPHKTIFNNFVSTLNILEYARQKNVRFVYAGSSSFHHGLYESPYAWSKHSGEQLCKLYSNVYDLSTVVCRFYNVYGPHQVEEGTWATVIGKFENQFRNNKPLTVVGDGEQRRDFTHIDDIVDGLIKCSEQPFRGEIFELGRGENYSINEIANMFGRDYPKVNTPFQPGEYDRTLADYSLAQDVLDWKPTVDIKDYIKEKLDEIN